MALSDVIGGSKPREKAKYVPAGQHTFRVTLVKEFVHPKDGRDFFCAEVEVVESTHPASKAGDPLSWMVNCTDAHIPGPRGDNGRRGAEDAKSFIAAGFGLTLDDVDPAGVAAVLGPANPLGGRLIYCSATELTLKSGSPFTKCAWSALEQ